MRVVAGSLKSRALRAPKGSSTRPTSDRVRESLFAVLGDVHGVRVLDLYSGSGALAIEALSRGATTAVCVESNRAAVVVIEENRDSLGLGDRLRVVARRVGDAVKMISGPFQLVLADPPWAEVATTVPKELALILDPKSGMVEEETLLVLEHSARDTPPELPFVVIEETRRWGDTAATFYRVLAPSDAPAEGQPPADEAPDAP